ncbi:hypothetical protein ACPTKJ_15285, partial [Enterococcus faecalis]
MHFYIINNPYPAFFKITEKNIGVFIGPRVGLFFTLVLNFLLYFFGHLYFQPKNRLKWLTPLHTIQYS